MIWTVSNMLSLFRLFLSIPAGIALWHNQPWIVLLIGITASITDITDGWAARKLNQVTEFGKIIDPLADKVIVGTVAIILLIQGIMPLWLGITMLARDVLILLGGLYSAKKLKYVIPSNYLGKITIDLICILFIGLIFRIEVIISFGVWVVLAGLIISFVQYLFNMIKLIKKAEN